MDKYENNSELVQLKIPMIRITSPNQLEACQKIPIPKVTKMGCCGLAICRNYWLV